MPGAITTCRGDWPMKQAMKPLKHNATDDDETIARVACIGLIFRADGSRYRVVDVLRDEINRLLAVGTLEG